MKYYTETRMNKIQLHIVTWRKLPSTILRDNIQKVPSMVYLEIGKLIYSVKILNSDFL